MAWSVSGSTVVGAGGERSTMGMGSDCSECRPQNDGTLASPPQLLIIRKELQERMRQCFSCREADIRCCPLCTNCSRKSCENRPEPVLDLEMFDEDILEDLPLDPATVEEGTNKEGLMQEEEHMLTHQPGPSWNRRWTFMTINVLK